MRNRGAQVTLAQINRMRAKGHGTRPGAIYVAVLLHGDAVTVSVPEPLVMTRALRWAHLTVMASFAFVIGAVAWAKAWA